MDVRADLEAALADLQAADGAGAGSVAGEAQPNPEPRVAPEGATSENNQLAEQAAAAARARDEAGRFAKAPEGQPKPEPAAAAGAAEPPTPETIRVPASLPAALKARFSELPQEWRDVILKREDETNGAKAQWDAKAQQFNRLDEIIAPRRERFQLAGMDEVQAIQVLFAAQDLLERDPLQGLSYLARSYGVDLRQLSQGVQAQAGTPLPDATLQPLFEQVRTLSQRFDASQQAAEQQQLARTASDIEAFRSDPKHLYFDNVRPQMIGLLKAGQAQSLEQAYEMACWASPEVRPLLQQQEIARQAAQQEAAERERAAKAARAGGSVTGAPGSAVQPAPTGSKGSVRDDLQAAYEQLS